MVHDIEENFQLNWLQVDETGTDMKPSKDAFRAHLKSTSLPYTPFPSSRYLAMLRNSGLINVVTGRLHSERKQGAQGQRC